MANHLEIRTVHLKFPDQAFPVAKALPLWPHEFAPRDRYGSSPVVLDTFMRKPGQKKNSRFYSGRKLFHEKELIVRAKLATHSYENLYKQPNSKETAANLAVRNVHRDVSNET